MIPTAQRLFVAGHRGMVGAALLRAIEKHGFAKATLTATRADLDLTRQADVEAFLHRERPDTVIVAAARVGGIHANAAYPADFAYDNLAIALNLVHAAHLTGVGRLLFLGSSCIYPKFAPQPIAEEALLTGALEPTNEAYAIAKIAGLKLCEYHRRQHGRLFHAVMPCNLYGPGDNYHPENSHVIPGLIRRFHEAKAARAPEVAIWGTGTPRREFLHVDDLAEACLHLLQLDDPPDLANAGSGEDLPILELAALIAEIVGYEGEIRADPARPDGTPRKLMDSSRLFATGWRPAISLRDGLAGAYHDFLERTEAGAPREA
ncbi:MAG: GDP-L-fucose synthase [Verrucomicrobiae bacterium]|nr:GDP-L-fucose synthase [Verrucomicrobiae bacterium]MCP5539140.1 GDP-L-fucose synthase [Akkermansiaceae bacterium]MCP5549791.1 GDP-L-fucose synthase [Akkermansiaceae bacterium]